MSLKSTIQHNQTVFVAAAICALLLGGFFACNLTQPQQEAIIATGVTVAEAATTRTPIPWHEIGLLIGTIIGTGAVIDNRRKDVVIKQEQKYSRAKTELLANLVNGNSTNSPR